MGGPGGLPPWVRVRLPGGSVAMATHRTLDRERLHTVCEEARCPNQGECWSAGTATLMILGDRCTRSCRFCAVASAREGRPLDPSEPARIARLAGDSGLRYVVITSVDRDDLPDLGAGHFRAVLDALKALESPPRVELLIPDYRDDPLRQVLEGRPDVLAHNLETTRRLTPLVRDRRASYDLSLEVLRQARRHDPSLWTKSSLMLGLGESLDEVIEAMEDLRRVGVRILTLGQYLRPTARHLPVSRWWTPEEFADLEDRARKMGFEFVASGPLVRSSYRAAELFLEGRLARPIPETASCGEKFPGQ
ncbi:lipoyl synthase [Myxococcota bacterium]|nr:lipoyl synthase [Myxococcota bacterium]